MISVIMNLGKSHHTTVFDGSITCLLAANIHLSSQLTNVSNSVCYPYLLIFMIFFLPTRLLGPTQLLGRSGYYQSEYQDLGSPHVCKTLKVTSKHSSFQGKYELSEVMMNGKPSWKWKEKHKGGFHLHLLVFPCV